MPPFILPKVVLSGLKEKIESLAVQGMTSHLELSQRELTRRFQRTNYILEVLLGTFTYMA